MKKLLLLIFLFFATITYAQNKLFVKAGATGSNNGTSWNNAYISLQNAIRNANFGDSIFVANGVYVPTSNSFELKNGVKIYGGFAGTETFLRQRNLSGNLAAGDTTILTNNANGYSIISNYPVLNITTATVLDGFTISNGNRTLADVGSGGGAINNFRASPTISNCIIKNSKSNYGALVNEDNANPVIKHCVFIKNSGTYGGAISNFSASPIIDSCTFISNEASMSGGALFSTGPSSPKVTNSSFTNNMTTSYTVSTGNGPVRFPGDGGAVANIDNSPIFDNCTFTGNKAANMGGGGAMFNAGTSLALIINCTFTNNKTDLGDAGAVLNNKGNAGTNFKVVLSKCVFSNNIAQGSYDGSYLNGGLGGAVCNKGVIDTIKNCFFLNNQATFGGGGVSDYYGEERSVFINTVFYGNGTFDAVNGFGAGGAYQNKAGGVADIINCVFANNKAGGNVDDGGGAIINYGGVINCTNTTFSNNVTDSPIAESNTISLPYGGTINMTNSIVYGNAAKQVYINVDPANNAYGPSISNYKNSLIKGISVTAPNLNVDPIFVNAGNPAGPDGIWGTMDDGLMLKANSPCINTGAIDTLGLHLPTVDIAGNPRIYNLGIVDMGAYEYAGELTTLPVSLSNFTAKTQGGWVKLDWQTLSERNHNTFVIYRSGGEGLFSKIGSISGRGESSGLKNYNYYDKNPLSGNNYYKLIQVDNDGKETDLGTRHINFGFAASSVLSYPNPTDDVVNISFDKDKYTLLTVVDLSGKVWQKIPIKAGESSMTLSLGSQQSGIYFFKLTGGAEAAVGKIVKH